MLSELIRRFRGLGIAIVVLALSAGVVFAAAPPFAPASSHANPAANSNSDEEQASESPSEEPSEEPSEDATESPIAAAPLTAPTDSADLSGPPADTHGALVSAAAHMDLPDGFPNRGAFVSCVARMQGATLTGFDWTLVTPDACGVVEKTPPGQAKSEAARTQAQEKAAAGKAKGQAQAAAAKAKHHD